MILRVVGLVVIGILVLAAADLYRIKSDLNVQVEHIAQLRAEMRRLQDEIAASRAGWCKLENSMCLHWLREWRE
jgi:hypothetical protein